MGGNVGARRPRPYSSQKRNVGTVTLVKGAASDAARSGRTAVGYGDPTLHL